ncbi:MAG: hypothetical protein JXR89_04710 [Deltaproteobacteria bacterium]|nr:hypothetical protein [Deltaproteobacteria bacterium]
MYDPPDKAPPLSGDIPPILATQAAAALSLRKRRSRLTRTYQTRTPGTSPDHKKGRAAYREILKILKQTCKRLKLHERNLHISLLEVPDGFILKAYDCQSNRQICRQINERFFHSPEKIERLLEEIMSGTGLLLDLSV